MIRKTAQPYFILFIGILAVSSASIFIRFSQNEVSSLVIAAYRLTLATLILTPFCLTKFKKEVLPLPAKTKGLLALSGIFLALHFALWITSLEYTSVTSSVVLVATTPIWVALLSPVFLKENPSKWVILGLTIAMLGGMIVGFSSGCSVGISGINCTNLHSLVEKENIWGNLMALGGAFFSCGYLIVGRKVREELSFTSYLFSVYGTAAITLIILVLCNRLPITGFSPINYIWLAALAIIPQLIGHSSFNWALKYLPASYVSIALLGEPVGTVLLAMVFLNESPILLEIVGGILILAGILLATRSENGK
jgi:drug/metabolite transporter (DMT)-like permease